MPNVISFKSRSHLDAQGNLDAFVSFARNELIAFGDDLPFDSVVWDVTADCAVKGLGNKRQRINFSKLISTSSNNPIPFAKKFLSFAQAYMRQAQAFNKIINISPQLQALRCLEAALTENDELLSPIHIDVNILNRAAQYAKSHYAKTQSYRVGQQIEQVSNFLAKQRMLILPLQWRNPIRRPSEGALRVGPEFDQRRAEKMPPEAALDALAYIFRNATEPRDVLVSSVVAILCSAPGRISEVLMLPERCETRGAVEDDGVYGLRWWTAKGKPPMIKWILPSMVDVVKAAIKKIREVTASARDIALWYQLNPGKLYLHPSSERLRSRDELTVDEVREILWGPESCNVSARLWCKSNNVQLYYSNGRQVACFSQLESAVIGMLPSFFPYVHNKTKLLYSDALFVVRKHELQSNKSMYVCMVSPINVNQINTGLGSSVAHRGCSVFESFGFTEPDGSMVKLTSHKFRHYLNTMAQAGGLSQLDIAKWSGRKNIKQNEAYDHVSAEEMLQIIREAVGDVSKVVGPLATVPQKYLIRRDEFSRLMIPTAHTTDIGYCIHDYTMSPCLVHRDCINCQEHICIKGDPVKTARLRQSRCEAEDLMSRAKAALEEGYFGSDRWLEHHMLTIERFRQLCEIMDDHGVPEGSIVQLNNVLSASRGEQGAIEQSRSGIAKGNQASLLKTYKQFVSARAKRYDD